MEGKYLDTVVSSATVGWAAALRGHTGASGCVWYGAGLFGGATDPGQEHKLSPAFLQCGSCFALRFSSMAASILFWQHSHPNVIAMEAKRTKPDWIPCPVTRRSSSCHRVTEQRLRHDDTVADCVGTGRSLRLTPPNTSRTKQGCVPRACPNAPELSQSNSQLRDFCRRRCVRRTSATADLVSPKVGSNPLL